MKNDGGPAFPVAPHVAQENEIAPPYCGMSLRDYFAAKAMQALLSVNPERVTVNAGLLAEDAYQTADAMLWEREK